ncbi:MAG: hypothetical protein ABSG16_23545 [Candidatus Acidiferrum sp.]|jgi:hypothetical protein
MNLAGIDAIIHTLDRHGTAPNTGKRAVLIIARARISVAQKKRWAKVKP